MSAHTPGEWFTSRPTPHGTIYIEARLRPGTLQEVAACGPTEAPEQREANARRIVSCVNALDGLPQDALDGGWTAKGASAHAKRLETVNEDLLDALSEMVERFEPHAWGSSDNRRDALENARAAIAKARGEA